MSRKSSFRWIRGIMLELLGVGLIVWVAVGAPLPDGDLPTAAPASHPFASFGLRHERTPARVWEARWLPQALEAPAAVERQAYTRQQLEAAGERLAVLGRQVAAALLAPLDNLQLRDLPPANDPLAPSCSSCSSYSSW